MKVLKVIANGKEYFAKIHAAVDSVELIEMQRVDYDLIPATQDADKLLGESFLGQ